MQKTNDLRNFPFLNNFTRNLYVFVWRGGVIVLSVPLTGQVIL